jgi:glycosyltransferase involved in cell wall biosynthesis
VKVVAWGTYDLGKPRARILLRGLRERGVEVVPRHRPVWTGVADKTVVSGFGRRLGLALRWLAAYPALVVSYLTAPRHDAVFVGYMGQLDVLVLWPWVKLRRRPVVWDAFLSLYSTVVEDRRLVSPRHPLARLLWAWEWLACRAVDRVVLDTRAHAELFRRLYRLAPERLDWALVGVEPEPFVPEENPSAAVPAPPEGSRRVLFYGHLIPLHGVGTILEAARRTAGEPIEWTIIGDGQERSLLEGCDLPGVRWIRGVPYGELGAWLASADVGLGIFGASDKAARVIPNKAFQVLAAERPLVTRDSPAIRELFDGDETPMTPEDVGVTLVPPDDPEALVRAIRTVLSQGDHQSWLPGRRALVERLVPRAVAGRLEKTLSEVAR